jgi:prepilin-type N-terminal cleavage/methylation domain-containing protein/prepilin-type processing-associated H-X9-DG protein
MRKSPNTRNARTGFTLIELLAVVGVIAVLISILIPSLGTARHVARTAVCGTNLRSLGQAMTVYSTEWEGAILGNAHTTGAHLYSSDFSKLLASENNAPGVITANDWLSPTARMMGLGFKSGPKMSDRIERFMQLDVFKGFTCPENDLISTAFTDGGGPNFPVHPMISYNTALCFQYTSGGSSDPQVAMNFPTLDLGSYRPRVQLVGSQAQKIYAADGGRWFQNGPTLAVTTNGSLTGTSRGGISSDFGPWDAFSRSYHWDGKGNADGRVASMRHGKRQDGASFQNFRFNAVFFDGHVETLKGLDGADPRMWAPKGTTIGSSEIVGNSDFRVRYGTGTLVIP